ncbi:MAG: ribokinase [Chloroflexota bacterium]
MNEIAIIGSLNMDLLVKTDHMPVGGETLHGDEFHMIPGGKGGNQAVAVARMGGQAVIFGRVGKDRFGDALSQSLAADQVDISHILVDAQAPTGVALIVVEGNGENRIIVVGGANRKVSPADILAQEDVLRQASMLILQFEIPLEVVESVLLLGQRYAIPLMVNAAPAYALATDLIALIDYLVVNEHEAATMSGLKVVDVESARQAARKLREYGARVVIITLGALGALAVGPEGEDYVPGFSVPALDTTAAGDAFIGGLAVALNGAQSSLAQKVRFANATGAITATRLGAQSSLPTRAEVLAFLEREARAEIG